MSELDQMDVDNLSEDNRNKEMEERSHFPVRGSDWSEVEFLDQSEEEKRVFSCRGEEHDFVVRGKNYMQDKKKVHTGPSVFRFILSEFVEVGESEEVRRHDHIAAKGRIKKRIEALQRLVC